MSKKLEAVMFTTLALRLVAGSVFEAIDEDFDGNPLKIKTGKNAGQDTQRYNFGVAVPKVPGKHWADNTSEFLTQIYHKGHADMGALASRDDFSWKVVDGDSTKLNKKNHRPCDNEGWPGHWIVFFSSSYAPSAWNNDGSQPIELESIKKGFYVQVAGSVVGNENTSNPGVYINHSMVSLQATSLNGASLEIRTGPDPRAAGFGKSSLPAGASLAPGAGMNRPASPPPPAAPSTATPPPAAPGAPLPPPTQVAPAASFIAPPATSTAPPPPPAAPAAPVAPVPQMTAKANGATYDSFRAQGWTDEQMRTGGYLI
jgi:hypothetical protein